MVFATKTNFYLVKIWFWGQKPTFTSQKDGSPGADQAKTIFLRGKSWFFYEKPSLYEAKPKKPIFSTSPPHSLKRWFFWFFEFASQKMVLEPQTNFYLAKRWFSWGRPGQNHLFTWEKLVFYEKPSLYEAKPKKQSFSTSPPHSLKKMVFLVFWSRPSRSRPSRRPVLWSVWGLLCRETATESRKKGIGHERIINGIYEGNRSG